MIFFRFFDRICQIEGDMYMVSLELKKYLDNLSIYNSNKDNITCLEKISNLFSNELDDFIYLINKYPMFVELLDCIFENNRTLIINNEITKVSSNKKFISIMNLYCIYNNIDINYFNNEDLSYSRYYYFYSIRDIPVLSENEEKLLFIKYNHGNEDDRKFSVDKLVKCNLKLVFDHTKKNVKKGDSFEDLISECSINLIKAIEKFDISKGYKFSTYATWWIRQAISHSSDRNKRSSYIYIPFYLKKVINEYNDYCNEFLCTNGRVPKDDEIERDLCYSKEMVNLVKQQSYMDITSIDEPVNEFGDTFLDDFLSDNSSGDFEKRIYDKEILEIFNSVLDFLKVSDRDRKIFSMKCGLYNGDEMTFKEIASIYGVTYQRIEQIYYNIIKKINKSEEAMSYFDGYLNKVKQH